MMFWRRRMWRRIQVMAIMLCGPHTVRLRKKRKKGTGQRGQKRRRGNRKNSRGDRRCFRGSEYLFLPMCPQRVTLGKKSAPVFSCPRACPRPLYALISVESPLEGRRGESPGKRTRRMHVVSPSPPRGTFSGSFRRRMQRMWWSVIQARQPIRAVFNVWAAAILY